MIAPVSLAIAENCDERIVLFPGFGWADGAGGGWRVQVTGRVTTAPRLNFRAHVQLGMLRRMMRADAESLHSELFQQRIAGFLAAPAPRRRIELRFGEQSFRLRPSSRNGLFKGIATLRNEDLTETAADVNPRGAWLPFEAAIDDGRTCSGRVLLPAEEGVTVVSDIDDTIKHSGVGVRHMLLTNTFLRDFVPISGMASLYQRWALQGAAFHYVSSSPWQLYEPLAQFCREFGFPDGAFHLRSFRITQQMLRKLRVARRSLKHADIVRLLQAYPRRRFVLVGDSGEIDPEMYGALARQHPEQVAAILIRNVASQPMTPERRRRVFSGLSGCVCQVFRHAEELELSLDEVAQV